MNMTTREHDAASTIRRDFERVDAGVVAAARALPTATLHEAGGRIGVLPSAIKPVAPAFRICGPAVTVQSPGATSFWFGADGSDIGSGRPRGASLRQRPYEFSPPSHRSLQQR
jgi:hypothetical protein